MDYGGGSDEEVVGDFVFVVYHTGTQLYPLYIYIHIYTYVVCIVYSYTHTLVYIPCIYR